MNAAAFDHANERLDLSSPMSNTGDGCPASQSANAQRAAAPVPARHQPFGDCRQENPSITRTRPSE
jgi:hypothetical protein